MKNSTAFRLGSFYSKQKLSGLACVRFNLSIGDALVVRQDELHVSDQDELKSGQHRLAIGFKFMRQAPVPVPVA